MTHRHITRPQCHWSQSIDDHQCNMSNFLPSLPSYESNKLLWSTTMWIYKAGQEIEPTYTPCTAKGAHNSNMVHLVDDIHPVNWTSWLSQMFSKYGLRETPWYWPVNNHRPKQNLDTSSTATWLKLQAHGGGGIYMYQLARWSLKHPKPLQEYQIELLFRKHKKNWVSHSSIF